ncbi:hypothetical protein QTP88_028114 [Uroleucon formosanum]
MDFGGTIESDWKEVEDNFNEMNLKEDLMRGISVYGLDKLSVIQQRAIVPCIKGQDVIVQAQSGTGMITTFSISILQQINTSFNECQALILAPTSELVLQIQNVVIALGKFMKVDCHACISKTNVFDNMRKRRKLNTVSHVVVGTPDCVYDMIVRKLLLTQYIKICMLDETDEILSQGFKDQIEKVFKYLKEDIQVILCSATMSEDVLNVSTHFMCNPVLIFRQKGKDNIKDSCNVPTVVTNSDAIANQKKAREFVRKLLHNDLPKEMMEWQSGSFIKSKQAVKITQQEIHDIIIDKAALINSLKSRYARQMENLAVSEQNQYFWYEKCKTLVKNVNIVRNKLERLIIDPNPNFAVKHVRNVGTNVCPKRILNGTTIL